MVSDFAFEDNGQHVFGFDRVTIEELPGIVRAIVGQEKLCIQSTT